MEYHFRSFNRRAVGSYTFLLLGSLLLLVASTIMYLYSPRFAKVSTDTTEIILARGGVSSVNVTLRNINSLDLALGDRMSIAARVFGEAGALIAEGPHIALGRLAIGSKETYRVELPTSVKQGRFLLKIDIVKEGDHWFADAGDWPACVIVVVR